MASQVAQLLKYADADAMMGDVARAARSVDYLLDYTWHTLEHKGKDGLGRILKRPRVATVAKNVSASNPMRWAMGSIKRTPRSE